MKKIFKKNQVIITALALMLCAAGYLQFSDAGTGAEDETDKNGYELNVSDNEGTEGVTINVGNMEEQGIVKDAKVKLHKGHGTIRCNAVEGCEEMVRRVYEAVCVGYEILANRFPKNISYTVC